jgi:hypothetical protein
LLTQIQFRKHQIENRFPELTLPTFFKMWFKFIKCVKNWQQLTDLQTFSAIFTFFRSWNTPDSYRTITLKMRLFKWDFSKKIETFHFGPFLLILATFYKVKITFWKKLVEEAPTAQPIFNLMFSESTCSALGYSKSVTIFYSKRFGSTSPSAWCDYNFPARYNIVGPLLKVFNSVVLDDPRKTAYKKVNRGSRETDPSQVYFGWNGGKIQIWFVANFFTQEILFCYGLTS